MGTTKLLEMYTYYVLVKLQGKSEKPYRRKSCVEKMKLPFFV